MLLDALDALTRFQFRVRKPTLRALKTLALLLAVASAPSCQRSREAEKAAPPPLSEDQNALGVRALSNYAELAYATYDDATERAKLLLLEIDRLLEEPSAERLANARTAWSAARRPYQQSEVFRFCDGPIDRVETQINTWPIDESYVEAGDPAAKPGIIEDARTYPLISPALLSKLNASEGETSISTGYHVIEFLLWGRDERSDGPGARPFSDYGSGRGKLTALSDAQRTIATRRGQYLRAATELLISQLSEVRDAWAPGVAGNYRSQFLKLPLSEALGRAIKGMGSLSGPELSGERLTVPYETKDQENEHSCFSDTTQIDLADDALGIENVCLGRYQREGATALGGPGLCDIIALRDATLAQRLKQEIAASVLAARRIPAPFDQAILGDDNAPGRKAIHSAIEALQRQTETLAKVAAAFDIRVSLADPRVQR
ncbi:MAG TPA: imelysin family protein [Polyangiaceae bacterium]|nr:imelysin family protein [Polyangiaceae bacterium]